jgi:hypothetical protein
VLRNWPTRPVAARLAVVTQQRQSQARFAASAIAERRRLAVDALTPGDAVSGSPRAAGPQRPRERRRSCRAVAVVVSSVDPGAFRRALLRRRTTTLGRGRCSRPRPPFRDHRAAGPPKRRGRWALKRLCRRVPPTGATRRTAFLEYGGSPCCSLGAVPRPRPHGPQVLAWRRPGRWAVISHKPTWTKPLRGRLIGVIAFVRAIAKAPRSNHSETKPHQIDRDLIQSP